VAALVGACVAVVHTAPMKLTREQQAALKKLRVREFDQDLRTFTAKQLRAEFSTQRTRRVLAKVLTRNVVYQAASWVIEGKAPKISGNLRSLYYQWTKPVVAKLPELLKTKVDFYDETLRLRSGHRLERARAVHRGAGPLQLSRPGTRRRTLGWSR
jgi:hypothetical protein